MRWPWISRASHDELIQLLTSQLSELKAERIILLDRLALLGLGGTLFNSPSSPTSLPDTEPAEALIDPREEVDRILAMRRRPSKMARAIGQFAAKEYNKLKTGPQIKWVPNGAAEVMADLDAAEQEGKRQA